MLVISVDWLPLNLSLLKRFDISLVKIMYLLIFQEGWVCLIALPPSDDVKLDLIPYFLNIIELACNSRHNLSQVDGFFEIPHPIINLNN